MHSPHLDGAGPADSAPSFWAPEDVVRTVTRTELIASGALVDLSARAPDVCRQHVGRLSVCCTASVWATIDAALRNEKYANDIDGVVHDLLWMARRAQLRIASTRASDGLFQVYILGAGRRKKFVFRITVTPGDRGEDVITILQPRED